MKSKILSLEKYLKDASNKLYTNFSIEYLKVLYVMEELSQIQLSQLSLSKVINSGVRQSQLVQKMSVIALSTCIFCIGTYTFQCWDHYQKISSNLQHNPNRVLFYKLPLLHKSWSKEQLS